MWGLTLCHTISLRGKIWSNKAILISPLFNEVAVPSQECYQICIYVIEASILTLSVIFLLECGTITKVLYSLLFILWLSYAGNMLCAIYALWLKKIYIKNKTDYEMKFKHWWDKIPSISTKRTIISHLNSLNATKYHEVCRGKSRSWPVKSTNM